jgi:DUF4097 and DUF4098 domain-containing protein YvlB
VRPRSITTPLILILIGVFFLIANVRPDLLQFSRLVDYWPFVLIAVGVIGLIEVLFYVSRGNVPAPRVVSGGVIFWVVVLCFFLAIFGHDRDFRFANFNTNGFGFFGSDYDYDVNAEEPAAGVTRLVLDNLRGTISVKGDDSGVVTVTGRQIVRAFSRNAADRAKTNNGVHLERNGDEMVVRADDFNGPRIGQTTDDLDIVVPRGMSVEARGRNGDLTIDDLDGTVDVSNGRGDIRLNHIGKDVKIDGSRGGDIHVVDLKGALELGDRGSDVQLENIAGPVTIKGEFSGTLDFRGLAKPLEFTSSRTEFRVEAVPGTITMDLGDLKMNNVSGPVRFQSPTRDIDATDVTDSLDLKLDRGDIGVTATHAPLPKMDIHTRDGDITLTLPEHAGFQIDGSTSQGDITSGFGSSLRIESSGRSATIKGQNGAGPQITVSTDRGTVALNKGD